MLANDTSPDFNANLSLLTVPAASANGAVLARVGNEVRYTPAADFAGTDSFTYTVIYGSNTNTGTVSVTVSAVNDAPRVALGGAQGANLLTNGSFETSTGAGPVLATGWSNAGSGGGFEFGGPGSFGAQPADGTQFIELDAGNFGGVDFITQTVATVAGTDYSFSFEAARRSDTRRSGPPGSRFSGTVL